MTKRDRDEPILGEVRRTDHRRVSFGLYLKCRGDLSADDEFRRELRAYLLVLPDGARFTHVTGAWLLGWRLPKLPEQTPVFAAVEGDVGHPRRHGLICSRLVRKSEGSTRHDLPVDEPEEILLRAARDLGVLDLVIMIDSALELDHLDRARMAAILESRRPGVRVLRRAYAQATAKCESGGETILRVFHHVMDVDVQPQANIYNKDGKLLGRADLLVTGTRSIHEYDGAVHRTGIQHRVDLRRDRGLLAASYERRGFVLDDLLNHPVAMMHELDRLLNRPHQLARLRKWRRLVDDSLYSEAGRDRIMNRWSRAFGPADWFGSA